MTTATLIRPAAPAAQDERARSSEPGPRWGTRLGLLAVLVEWLGFHWDVAWHINVGRDRFVTPPHMMILSGIVGAALAAAVTINAAAYRGRPRRPGMVLLGLSALAAFVTLGVDNWFHQKFGVDLEMWSPPHVLLGLTFMVGLVGVMIDHAGSRRSSAAVSAALAGAFLAISSLSLAEYEFGSAHHRILWSPVLLGLLVGFVLALGRRASGHRWSGTIAASTFIALRVAALGFNAAVGRSVPAFPLGVLAGGVAFDLVRRGRVRQMLAAWSATFAVQVVWLHVVGRTWWTTPVLLPGFLLGAAAALGGGWIGSGVGRPLAAAARRTLRMASGRAGGRTAVFTTAVLVVLVSCSGWGQLVGRGQTTPAYYSVRGDRVRVVIQGANSSDWVSIFGPSKPLGLFNVRPKPGRYIVPLSMLAGIPPEVQGPRLRALRLFPLHVTFTWLGGLDWHNGGFEGRIRGSGEFVTIWYVHGEHASEAVVERGSSGPVVVLRHAVTPAIPPGPWDATGGTAAVALLVILLIGSAALALRSGARRADSSHEDEIPVEFRPLCRPRTPSERPGRVARRARPLVATRER